MISQLLIILTALIFFALGYSVGHPVEATSLLKQVKRALRPSPGIVITYPTAEETAYRGTEQEEIDRQQEKLIKEAGLA